MDKQLLYELLMFLVGLFILILGLAKNKERKKLISDGSKTQGTVIQLVMRSNNDPNNPGGSYYPVIRYTANEKEWFEEEYNVGANIPFYKKGDKVDIFYNPADPKKFTIDDNSSNLMMLGLILFGVLLIGGGVVCYLFKIPIKIKSL